LSAAIAGATANTQQIDQHALRHTFNTVPSVRI
jgi:hypothetical protein